MNEQAMNTAHVIAALVEKNAEQQEQIRTLQEEYRYWMKAAEERMKIISKNESAQETISDLQAKSDSDEKKIRDLQKANDYLRKQNDEWATRVTFSANAEVKAKQLADLYSHDIHKLSREIEELKSGYAESASTGIITDLQEKVRQLNLQVEGYEYNLESIRNAVARHTKGV